MGAAHFRQLQAWDLARLAEVELDAGDLPRGQAVAREAAGLADTIGFHYVRGRAEHVCGQVALMSGAVPDAMQLLTSTATLFERIEAPYEWARTTLSLADAHAAGGDHERAACFRYDALERATRIGVRLPGDV